MDEAGTCISLYYAYELNKIETLEEVCSLYVYGSHTKYTLEEVGSSRADIHPFSIIIGKELCIERRSRLTPALFKKLEEKYALEEACGCSEDAHPFCMRFV